VSEFSAFLSFIGTDEVIELSGARCPLLALTFRSPQRSDASAVEENLTFGCRGPHRRP